MAGGSKPAVSEQHVGTPDGTEIFVKQYHVSSPKAQVIISHGYLEHCQRYCEFAEYLNTQAISVTLFDFRGHGLSSGDRAFISKWNEYTVDFETASSTLLPTDKVPTFYLGHSNGGLFLMDYLLTVDNSETTLKKKNNIKGVILTSPFLMVAGERSVVKRWLSQVLGSMMPHLQTASGLAAKELMSDPHKQKEHDEDTLCVKNITLGWAKRALEVQDRVEKKILEDGVAMPIPLYFCFAGQDSVANPQMNAKVAKALKGDDVTVRQEEEELHEVLNGTNRKELYGLISKWILDRV